MWPTRSCSTIHKCHVDTRCSSLQVWGIRAASPKISEHMLQILTRIHCWWSVTASSRPATDLNNPNVGSVVQLQSLRLRQIFTKKTLKVVVSRSAGCLRQFYRAWAILTCGPLLLQGVRDNVSCFSCILANTSRYAIANVYFQMLLP